MPGLVLYFHGATYSGICIIEIASTCTYLVLPIAVGFRKRYKIRSPDQQSMQLARVGDLHVQFRIVIIPKAGFLEQNLEQIPAQHDRIWLAISVEDGTARANSAVAGGRHVDRGTKDDMCGRYGFM